MITQPINKKKEIDLIFEEIKRKLLTTAKESDRQKINYLVDFLKVEWIRREKKINSLLRKLRRLQKLRDCRNCE